MQLCGRRYDTGQLVAVDTTGSTIARVASPPNVDAARLDTAPWIAPGLIDLQVNGAAGVGLTDPALDVLGVRQVSLALDAGGVVGYLPTLTTHAFDVLRHGAATIAAACNTDAEVACRVLGIHLEGPYLSPQDGARGAHPLAHCHPPDWDEFQRLQEAAEGRIRLITLSAEYDGAAEFTSRAIASGVVVAIGHTAATPEQITAVVDAGARLSTHLGNGSHAQLPRLINYLWAQLADDRLVASLIVDAHHLPAEVVKTFVRAKTPRRCMLISDLTRLAEMPPGRYDDSGLGAVDVLPGGRLVMAGQRQLLAGASAPICSGVANVMRFTGIDLATAVDMAGRHPAQLLDVRPPTLEVGAAADLIQFDLPGADGSEPVGVLTMRAVIKSGQLAWGSPWQWD